MFFQLQGKAFSRVAPRLSKPFAQPYQRGLFLLQLFNVNLDLPFGVGNLFQLLAYAFVLGNYVAQRRTVARLGVVKCAQSALHPVH